MKKVFIVDDEEDMLENCCRLLNKWGYTCLSESDSERAMEVIQKARPDILVTDLKMPGVDGLELLKEAKSFDPNLMVILITAYATVETAVKAMKEGAFDYIPKPFSSEQLKAVIERAFEKRGPKTGSVEIEGLEREGIIGNSFPLLQVLEMVKKVATTDANVIIYGESGTGKELIARCLHRNSLRSKEPFVPVDCAALPETLLETELFGNEKGAFTGAFATRQGLFEMANRGTIFFDEIGELSPNLQAKLLRVLQERQVRRVGGRQFIDVDVRVVCATNRDIPKAIQEKKFREDLYYRLNVISLSLPPLRDRGDDTQLLLEHFLKKFSMVYKKPVKRFGEGVMQRLCAYSWPGNVRELMNIVERAVSLCEGEAVFLEHLPLEEMEERQQFPAAPVRDLPARDVRDAKEAAASGETPLKEAKKEAASSLERDYLIDLLKRTGGNISQAAREAKVDRKTIHRMLKKHGLSAAEFGAREEEEE